METASTDRSILRKPSNPIVVVDKFGDCWPTIQKNRRAGLHSSLGSKRAPDTSINCPQASRWTRSEKISFMLPLEKTFRQWVAGSSNHKRICGTGWGPGILFDELQRQPGHAYVAMYGGKGLCLSD